jgi:ribosomal protein S18 acetylase RimI-like enzyme
MAGKPREPMPGFDAELFAIDVLPGRQGRGLGRGLLLAAAGAMAAAGRRAWFLWTLRDNPPTRAFYEALGGRVVAERTAVVEGVSVAEVAYGWDPLETLLLPSGATPPGV